MGAVSWCGLVVYMLRSAKRRAYICKSIAIEMGGASRYFSKVLYCGQGSTWLSRWKGPVLRVKLMWGNSYERCRNNTPEPWKNKTRIGAIAKGFSVCATFCQEAGILLQKYRDRNGRCIALLWKVSRLGLIRLSCKKSRKSRRGLPEGHYPRGTTLPKENLPEGFFNCNYLWILFRLAGLYLKKT